MVMDGSEHNKLFVMHVTIVADRKQLVQVIGGLAGFLGRYLLLPGPSIHTSATCVLILAEDRQQENDDGTLKRVALKCMKNELQFLTELRMREGLDPAKVVSALRVHVPPSFKDQNVLAMTDRPTATTSRAADSPSGADMEPQPEPVVNADAVEPEPESDSDHVAGATSDTTQKFSLLLGVEMLKEVVLDAGAEKLDPRLTGQYVIVMDCAACDLGSDISHGHYAGRDKKRVRQLLKKIIECFFYCEQQKFIHGDIK